MSITTEEQVITPEVIDDAMDYDEYRQMIDSLLEQGKTTGTNHSEAMLHYTKMNVQRMKRIDKRAQLTDSLIEQLDELDRPLVWLVITEAWCGDAAQNVPVIAKMATQNDNIDLKLILRDQNLEIMDNYLTNGGRSIPKLVCLDAETLEELGSWGPRPEVAQQMAMEWKNDPEVSKEDWAKNLHKWYARNRTEELQSEFEELISDWQK
jgi:hypothetical protein